MVSSHFESLFPWLELKSCLAQRLSPSSSPSSSSPTSVRSTSFLNFRPKRSSSLQKVNLADIKTLRLKDIKRVIEIVRNSYIYITVCFCAVPRSRSSDPRLVALARVTALSVGFHVTLHDQHPLFIIIWRVLQRLGDVRMLLRMLATAAS